MDDKIYQMRFPQKLWYLLNLRPDAVLWGGTGRTILLDYRILQNYLQCDHSVFKTTNISSFVRQLNLYGFRKVTSHLQDPLCNSSNPFMHEYVHDYFQYGRPELLSKISRKALTMKQSFKPKNAYHSVHQLLCMTPLQKARHALQVALKKAAENVFTSNSSKQLSNIQVQYEDPQEDMCEEEENFEIHWMPSNNINNHNPIELPPQPAVSATTVQEPECEGDKQSENFEQIPAQQVKQEENENVMDENQDSLMSFSNDSCQGNSDSFSTPFLNMPDLDPVPTDSQTGAELLAEFNIENDIDEGIARKIRGSNEHASLNCVLPSISQDQNDYAPISENNVTTDQYNGEWDQMFNDMITRGASQECGSELKELYSQISKTIDLLNS